MSNTKNSKHLMFIFSIVLFIFLVLGYLSYYFLVENKSSQNNSYSIANTHDYAHNSAERILSIYIYCWYNKDWNGMVKNCLPSWVKAQNKPAELLSKQYSSKTLVGSSILNSVRKDPLNIEVTVELHYSSDNKKVSKKVLKITVVNENGTWGVDPLTAVIET